MGETCVNKPCPCPEIGTLHDLLVKWSARISNCQFDSDDPNHQLFILLNMSTMERCDTVLLLVKSNKAHDAEIVLRSALDHFVEAKLSFESDDFLCGVRTKALKGLRLALETAADGNNFYSSLKDNVDIDGALSVVQREKSLLQNDTPHASQIQAKFREVNMQDIYDGLYRDLSSQVHADYIGLRARHITTNLKTGKDEFKSPKPPSQKRRRLVIKCVEEIAKLSISLINEFETTRAN